ncbi:MAG: tetratricopeptide repeat protein [Chloroflexota bacterium]
MLPDMDDLMAGVLLPLVPDIAQLLQRPVAPAPNLNESAAQQRLFMTIARLFWQVERPLLLILEDLHWSDASLLPLPYLLRLVAEHKLLIISSYRNDERPNLPNELPEMTHLPLARLGAAAMANLSAAMLGEAGRDQEIQALLQRETEGNAFFAVEVVRALAEEAGRLGDIGKVTLPETLLPNGIQDIVQRRVSKLSELARELLVKTAVAGRELELPLIQQLSGSLNVENEWLPLCADAAILNVQNGVWQFSHGKIRDGLLAELTAVEKTARHEEVASAIEQIYSQPATQAVRLAHHWREALDSEKEQHYAKIAGDEAAAQYAHQDALFYFNRILELTSPTDWAKRYSLLFQCFNTYALTGDLDKQQETLQALSGCAEQLDDNAKRLETLVEYTSFYRKYRQSDKLEAIYTRAVPLAQKIGDIRNEFVLLTNWALFLGESRQLEAAFMTLEQSRSLYERLGTVTTRMSYLVTAANLNYYAEDVDKSLGYLTEYLQLAEESKLLFPIFRGSSNIGVIYQAKGEFELAEQHYKRALQVARERGELNGEVLTLINTGDLCNLIGQYEQTIAISETVLSASEQIGRWYFYRLGLLNRGWARFKLGAIDQAKAVLQDVIRRSQAANDAWNEVAGWNKLGHIFLSTRHPNEALQAFQTAESRQADLSQTSALVETWAGLAGAEMALGHLEQATAYAEQVVTYVHAEGLKDSWLWVQSILYVYQVLSKAGSEEAQEILAQAHAELQIRAAKFTKATSRENFLMQVPENEQLLLLYKQLGKGEQGAIDDNSF